MKKVMLLMTTLAIVIISIGCSKDHSAPTFGKYVQPKPSNVAVSYTAGDETADVSWDMTDLTDVVGYQLSVATDVIAGRGPRSGEPSSYLVARSAVDNGRAPVRLATGASGVHGRLLGQCRTHCVVPCYRL